MAIEDILNNFYLAIETRLGDNKPWGSLNVL